MRVGLVRKVALGAIALVAVGIAGCDENPLVFSHGVAVLITTNPSVMTVPAGVTTLLKSRTVDEGNRPTWDDISHAIDATCGGASVIVTTAASYEPEVQPPGVFDVTGGNTIGTTCITLSGGGVTASVEVTVVGDSLEILGATSPMVVFDTQQLSAALLADDGTPVAPFDPLTDITWSSNLSQVASVDATGLVTGTGAGTATITATWSNAGVTVTASVDIAVEVPPPVLTSTDVATADEGDVITITGTGLLVGPHSVFINGFEVTDALLAASVDNATTAQVRMPPGNPGDIDIQVGSQVGGLSNALTVTRTSDDFEPGNDDQAAGGETITLPADITSWIDGAAGDQDDYWAFTLGAGTTFDITLSWVGASGDMDLLFIDRNPVTAFQCGFVTATAAVPESGQCTLGAGDYAAWVNDYAHVAGLTEYNFTLTP